MAVILLVAGQRPLLVLIVALAVTLLVALLFQFAPPFHKLELRSPVGRVHRAAAPQALMAEIEQMIWGITGRLNDVPLTRGDHALLAGIMRHYRNSPWIADPEMETQPRASDTGAQATLLELRIGVPSYAFHAPIQSDGKRETLERIKDVMVNDFVPRMRHWDAAHADR